MSPPLTQPSGSSDPNTVSGVAGEVSVVSWTSPSTVPLVDLLEGMRLAKFDSRSIREMLPKNAFARIRHTLERHFGDLIRDIGTTGDEIVVQFTEESVQGDLSDGTARLDYRETARVRIGLKTWQVQGSDQSRVDVVQRLLIQTSSHRTRTDVTRLLKRFFRTGGTQQSHLVPFTPSGYTYLVPHVADAIEKLNSAELLLRHIGGALRRVTFNLDRERNAQEVFDMLDQEMSMRVAELQAEVEGLLDAKADQDVLKRRVEASGLLSLHIQLMGQFLADRASSLQATLADVTKDIGARLLQCSDDGI